ncbi:MAG: hypothetical protein MR698_03325 [Selenomonas sp.]|nr:hypothetical protein [Selenomonas sp.]
MEKGTIPAEVKEAWDLRAELGEMQERAERMAFTLEMLADIMRRQAEVLDRAENFMREHIYKSGK